MAQEYLQVGKKITIEGENYYSADYNGDCCSNGFIYKSEKAFKENPDEVCYIPEHAFVEASKDFPDDILCIDGEKYLPVGGYTRKDLEALIEGEVDCDGDPLEAFFNELLWAYPETYLNEIAC